MERKRRQPWVLPLSVAVCSLGLALQGAEAAQDPKTQRKGAAAQPAEPVDNRAIAEKALEDGVQALDAGKPADAVKSLTKAIQTGGLTSQQMAKALYRRGVAYRKLSQTAPAIADLTSALWLKGGLSETERVDALNNRALAYREAGLSERADADVRRSEVKPSTTPQVSSWKPETAGGAGAPAATAPSPGGIAGFFGSWFGGNKSAAPAAVKPAATPAAVAPATQPAAVAPWQTSVSAATEAK